MEAVAKRCDTCIIVVEERQDGTTVPYVFGSNKKRTFPVILLLKNEHFQLIRKREGHAFPVEWEKSGNTNDAYRLQLRGLDDGRQTAHHARDGLRRLKIPIARSSDSGLVKHPVLRMFLPAARRELKCLTKVLRAGSLPLFRLWGKTTPKTSWSVVSNETDTALGISFIDKTQSRAWAKATPSRRTSADSVSCSQNSCSFQTCANYQGLAAQTKESNRGENKRLGAAHQAMVDMSAVWLSGFC